MARLLGDQLEQQEAKIALAEDARGAFASARAQAVQTMTLPAERMPAPGLVVVSVLVKSMHSKPFLDISKIQIYLRWNVVQGAWLIFASSFVMTGQAAKTGTRTVTVPSRTF